MKIRITGPVEARDAESDVPILDVKRLQALDGQVYREENLSDHFGDRSNLAAIGVTGGELTLVYDATARQLRVVAEYVSPRKLKAKELKALADETTGQWSAGIGAEIAGQWVESHGISLDFAPPDCDTELQVEQFK